MANARSLRSADALIGPGLTATLAAIEPVPADQALVSLARALAETADSMPPALRPTMLPQTSGQLVRVLAELEKRAAARRRPAARAPSRLQQLRAASAAEDATRRG